MAQSFLNSLTAPSGSSFVPKPALADTSSAMNPQNMPLMQAGVVPQVTTPTVQSTPVAPVQSPTEMYNPTVGTSTQRVADATYANAMNQAVSGSTPVPSSVIGSGSNLSSAGATRSTNEAILQQYLDQQKQYQQQLLQANQAGPTESAAAQRYNQLKTQAALNQEQALASGETSSFAGGEAQRVARTDAIKLAGAAADLQYMTGQREQAVKTLEALMASGDKSFSAQLKIQELQQTVSGIDKQAQDTFFNISQTEGIDLPYDPTKTATENLSQLQKVRASQPEVLSSAKVQSTVNQLTSEFRNEPVVKQYNTIASVMSALNEAGTNPTDDIQRIYTFAKIMDPESAVREGEYDTIGEYAVSYVQKLGLKANRIFNNDGFLTDEARKFMLNTLNTRYKAAEKSYQNLYEDYSQRIEQAKTGDVGGTLANYQAGYTPSSNIGKNDYTAQDTQAIKKISPSTKKTFTQEQIDEYKRLKGFSQVGSDTKPATEQNLTSGFAGMDLLQPAKPLELTSDSFANMGGLMQSTTPLQMSSVEIPKSSKLSFVNNNPGNLRFAGQYGAIKGEGGFAKFKTPQEGFDALIRQIKLDVSRGHTIASFINKFAPPTENDTKLYIQQAVKALGYKADTPLNKVPLNELAKFVALKESSTKVY